MNALIVHAHHEPKSFCSALFRQAVQTLTDAGHDVVTSDLYAQKFDPVSDRRNFTSVHDPDYLKQQKEEQHASDVNGFSPELEAEIRKLEACDLLVFTFPIWWFALPAILKGWVDRAFPMRRIYGDGKLYENALGKATRRAIAILTIGGGPDAYGGFGVNPSLATVLAPIQHGIFWFNGFLPLEPFVAWSPAPITQDERMAYLRHLDERLRHLDREHPQRRPPLADFPGFGKDQKKRFMVTATRTSLPDLQSQSLPAAEAAQLAELKRIGVVLTSYHAAQRGEQPREFIVFRENSEDRVRQHLNTLPMAAHSRFEVTELTQG